MEQFIASFEGHDDDVNEAFESFMAGIGDDTYLGNASELIINTTTLQEAEPYNEQEGGDDQAAFFILAISQDDANSIVQELANRSFSH